ncbi:MAG: synthase delta subunit [Planctomycetota bacterium]|jgi:F-type H+-transporting ATPase subunit delta
MTLLAKRYASALLMAARAAAAEDAVAKDLAAVHAVVEAPGVRAMISSPDLTEQELARVLGKVVAGLHPLVQNLVKVLQHRRRVEVLFDLQPSYRALLMAQRGELEGVVETARALDAQDEARLRELAGKIAGKKVALTVQVRPELIGGVRLRIGNVLYDGSLQSALAQLEKQLLQATL